MWGCYNLTRLYVLVAAAGLGLSHLNIRNFHRDKIFKHLGGHGTLCNCQSKANKQLKTRQNNLSAKFTPWKKNTMFFSFLFIFSLWDVHLRGQVRPHRHNMRTPSFDLTSSFQFIRIGVKEPAELFLAILDVKLDEMRWFAITYWWIWWIIWVSTLWSFGVPLLISFRDKTTTYLGQKMISKPKF